MKLAKLKALTKVAVRNMFSEFLSKKTGRLRVGLLILLAVCFLPIAFLAWQFCAVLYQSLAVVGAQQAVPAMAVGVVSLVIFFLSLLMLPGNLYYSKDIKPILAYPVKCAELLSSRFIPALLYEYMFSVFVLAPALVSFGVSAGAGVLYYAVAVVVFLFTPILPLVMSGILVMLMMRFTSLFRNRDLLTKVGSLLLLAAVLFLNFKISGSGESFVLEPGQALNIAEIVTSSVNRIFFTAPIAGLALTGNSALSMLGGALLFLAVSAAGYALFLLCGEKLYRAGLLGLDNTSAKRVKIEAGALRRLSNRQNPAVAIAKKDFKIMLRSPVFFMNNLISCFLIPIILLIPVLLQRNEMSLLFAQLGLSSLTPDSSAASTVLMAGLGLAAFIIATNGISASAISRDGSNYIYNHFVPVKTGHLILGKLLPGLVVSFLSALLTLIVAFAVTGLSLAFAPYLLADLILIVLCINLFGLCLDSRYPKVDWQEEAKAVKQNFNVMLELLASIVLIAAAVLLYVWVRNFYLYFGLLSAVLIVLSALLTLYLCRTIKKNLLRA